MSVAAPVVRPKREDVTSVVETCDGNVVVETIGVSQEHDAVSGPFVVLYQRGLRSNPHVVQRSHHNLLSPFKIKCTGVGVANVPWKNFGWLSNDRKHAYVNKPESTTCASEHCSSLFCNVTVNNIKVVCLHKPGGALCFRWYVAFTGDGGVLTRVPTSVVDKILGCNLVHCKCGRCVHPIRSMLTTPYTNVSEFCTKAVKVFSNYRSNVQKRVKEEKHPPMSTAEDFDEFEHTQCGTCAVCLEQKLVSTSSCIQKKCGLPVCFDCQKQTMGLCPLCDRSKLSTSGFFLCNCCERSVPLKDYAFDCITCKSPKLCSRCYKSFSQCLSCELNSANNSDEPKRKKRRVDTPCTC